MKKITFFLIIITFFSKLAGFIRDIFLSYYYGASNITDAFFISMTIPNVIFTVIISGLVTSFIPIYKNIIHEGKSGFNFTNNIINILLLFSLLLFLICQIFLDQIVYIFAYGFDLDTFQFAKDMTRITLLAFFISPIVGIFTGYLQSNSYFLSPALVGIPLNIIMMIFIYYSYKLGSETLLSWGFIFSILSQIIVLYPFLKKTGYKHKLIINIFDHKIHNMIKLSAPIILGIAITQINLIIDRRIASGLVEGAVSALNYSDKIIMFIQGVFVLSIINIFFPTISEMFHLPDKKEVNKYISNTLNLVIFILVPVTFFMLFFSVEIVSLLYFRGAFSLENLNMTSNTLFYYSFGIIGLGFREILVRVFFSKQNTITPMVNSTIGVILNIFLNIILSRIYGVSGLAMATSISITITVFLLFISLKKSNILEIKDTLKYFISTVFISFFLVYANRYLYTIFSERYTVEFSFTSCFFIYFFAYLLIMIIRKDKTINEIIKISGRL